MSVRRPALALAALVIGFLTARHLARQAIRADGVKLKHGDDRIRIFGGPEDDETTRAVRPDLELPAGGERRGHDGGGVKLQAHSISPEGWIPVYTNRPVWFVSFHFGRPNAPPTYAGRWTGADPFHLNIPQVDHD